MSSVAKLPTRFRAKRSLAQSFRVGLSAFADTNTTYQTNVCVVNTYVNNVMSSTLPTVPVQPTDWSSYVTAWEKANTIALQWVNSCMARLLSVPQDVQNYNSAITTLLNDAIAQTNNLITNPNDTAAKVSLESDLKALPNQFTIVETFISGALSALKGFQDNLPTMAAELQQLSDLAIQDNNADSAKIQQLQADVQTLQADIDSLTKQLIALGIADGVAITLGVVSSIVLFPEGLLTWFALGPAVAVASTFIAIDAEKLKADKAAIDADQQQMDQLTASCSVLSTLSTTYGNLASQSQTIEQSLQAVLAEWQQLTDDVNAAIADIQAAITDEGDADYTAVLNDLTSAQSEWNAAYTEAGSLVLDLNVNNAPLTIGMSSDEVSAALANGKTVDMITYFNQVA